MSRTSKTLIVSTVLVIAAVWLYLAIHKTMFYRAALPAELGLTSELVTAGSCADVLDMILPVRPKAAGGALFRLDAETLAAIKRQGSAFFDDALLGRGYGDPSRRVTYRYSYKPWQETPLPPEWTSDGMWLGLSCMGLNFGRGANIAEAARAPGSYYTTGIGAMLLVIPDLGIVVYTYSS